ncbi:MAG: diadenylate cyclase CdaA [Chthoniobacterales bacterium]
MNSAELLGTIGEFIRQNWTAAIEIGIIAVVLYLIYKYLRGTRGARILIGLGVIFITLTLISQILDLAVIGWLLRSFSVFLAIALVVIFQPELRRALTELGSHRFFSSSFEKKETIEELTDTVFELAGKGFGALIAVEREIDLKNIADTGVMVDCDNSKELTLTVFLPKTVLHDGCMIGKNDRILAAGCIFPLTQREDLDRNLGLRHRAALGMSEESDAITLIVSEETGQVSICHNGVIERNLNVDNFRRQLSRLLLLEEYESDAPKNISELES